MHFYSTASYEALCRGQFDQHLWQTFMPQEAFKHRFLLDAIFAFTCLHKAFLFEDEAPTWNERAIEYQNRGLADFTHMLGNLTESNCQAALLFSSLTIIIAFAHVRYVCFSILAHVSSYFH